MQRTLGQTEMRRVKQEACACRRHNALIIAHACKAESARKNIRKRGKAEKVIIYTDDLQPACVPQDVQLAPRALLPFIKQSHR